MLDRLLVRFVRRCWRCYQALSFTVADQRFQIPIRNGIGLELLGDSHPIEPYLDIVYRRKQGAFVDVGANVGRVLLAVARMDRTIPYVGFEPLVDAAEYVRVLIRANGLAETHRIYAVALSDRTVEAEIRFNEAADVSASMATDLRPSRMYRSSAHICAVPGDIFLGDMHRIAAIKIDAEGWERPVLEGLRATLARERPAVLLEIMPYSHFEDGSYDAGYFGHPSQDELQRLIVNRKEHMAGLEAFFAKANYQLCQIDGGKVRTARAEEATFDEQDFLAVPAEELDRWLQAAAD